MQTFVASPFVPAISMRHEEYFYSTQPLPDILEEKRKRNLFQSVSDTFFQYEFSFS